MKSVVIIFVSGLAISTGAAAQNCSSYPNQLTNGQTADANQVMANFNTIFNCVNSNVAPIVNPVFGGSIGVDVSVPLDLVDASAGVIRANGFRARAGTGGATSNIFNIFWSGAGAQLWIDNVNVGTISTSSDRRLKHSIEPAKTALPRVMQLRPVTFNWQNKGIFRDDGIRHEGFVADEVQAILPSAVNYKKDEVNKNGEPLYQSINPSEIIPVLTKAIQEQQAEIEELRHEIAAVRGAAATQ